MSLLHNLVFALVVNGQIKTTLAKAKSLRPYVEKMITMAKKQNSIHHKRILLSRLLNNKKILHILLKVSSNYLDRNGGYTRILKNGYRKGDNAPMAIIQLL